MALIEFNNKFTKPGFKTISLTSLYLCIFLFYSSYGSYTVVLCFTGSVHNIRLLRSSIRPAACAPTACRECKLNWLSGCVWVFSWVRYSTIKKLKSVCMCVSTFRSGKKQLVCSIETEHRLGVSLSHSHTLQRSRSAPLQPCHRTDHTPAPRYTRLKVHW